jgi:hypothetical protein
MRTHRYWPWTSLIAGIFVALLIIAFFVMSAVEIAHHRWSRLMLLMAVFAAISAIIAFSVRYFRSRFDYYIRIDDQSLSLWSAKGVLTVQRDVAQIEWLADSFVVRAKSGSIVVTKAYAGFGSLKRLVRSWEENGSGD